MEITLILLAMYLHLLLGLLNKTMYNMIILSRIYVDKNYILFSIIIIVWKR